MGGFWGLIQTNLRRHRLRSLFGIAGIAFGVAAMLTVISVVTGAIGMFRTILESDSHLLIFEENVSDLFFSSVPEAAWEAMATMPEAAEVHPLLFGIVRSEAQPVITCFGVTQANPRLVQARWLAGERADFGTEPGTVCLGKRAAGFLGASLGDAVQIGNNTYTVSGIIETRNGFEDGGVFMPLAEAQRYFHREGYASAVSILLKDVENAAQFRQQVEREWPTLAALENETFGENYSQFRILTATAWAVGACAFLLGGMSVANTMTLSVFTRIREIAVLRVCGFSRWQTALLILGEGCVLAAVGVSLGLALGLGMLVLMKTAPWLQGYIQISLSPGSLIGIICIAVVTSIGGSLYPAWLAAHIQPAEALRYE